MPTTPIRLALLGGFTLVIDDAPVLLPLQSQRVLAYVSVASSTSHGTTTAGDARRPALAAGDGATWPEHAADGAVADPTCRSPAAARPAGGAAAGGGGRRGPARAAWRRRTGCSPPARDMAPGTPPSTRCRGDLLPGWDEDWLLLERERIRQLHLHALEALAHRLRARGRYAEAVDAALAAVTAEPLRESAQSALISVHLAEGNVTEAYRQYDSYTALLWAELRITPSAALAAKVRTPRNPHEQTEGSR